MGKFIKKNNQRKGRDKQQIKKNVPKTRKDIRKEKRTLKKVHRREYNDRNRKNHVGQFVKFPQNKINLESDDDIENEVEDKHTKNVSKKTTINNTKIIDDIKADRKREAKLKSSMKEHRNSQLLKANEEEDKIIKKLEKQLKLKKKSSGAVSKSFASDGLNYLLEVCDQKTSGVAVATEKHLMDDRSGSDFEEDFAIATGKAVNKKLSKTRHKSSDDEFDSDDFDDNESDASFGDLSDENFDDDSDESSDEKQLPSKHKKDKTNKKAISKSNSIDTIESVDVKKKSITKEQQKIELNNQNLSKNKLKGKCLVAPIKSEDSEDSDDDGDEMENNTSDEQPYDDELTEEEIEMLYTGAMDFPDGIFRPGELPPIYEETESDIDDKKMMNVSFGSSNSIENSDSDESQIFENGEIHMSEPFEDSSDCLSDDSKCNNPECYDSSSDCLEKENKQIIVNGKIINTYGRDVASPIDEDFVRCPELDKILENLSDSDVDLKNVAPKDAVNNYTKGNKVVSVDNANETNLTSRDKDDKSVKKKRKKCDIQEDNDFPSLQNGKALNKKIKRQNDTSEIDSSVNTKTKNKKKDKTKLDSQSESDEEQYSDLSCPDEEMSDNYSDCSEKAEIHERKILADGSWEDIYGRKRDMDGNIVNEQAKTYIPPHLRTKSTNTDTQEIIQLKRQIKGLLNKVAYSNMHWTSTQLEAIYNSHSRNAVNNAFCSLWMDAIIKSITVSDRMAVEHATLVALCHANIGSEIGAHFLQTIMKRFNDMMMTEQELENKELDNLILGLSHLYSFKIFQASLLYEVLNKFVENLSEKNIECILVALRSVGGVLRKEDPSALKAFIHTTQEKAGKINYSTGSRIHFLLDVLLAIKNNNMNKIPNYDPSYSEELKKSMKGIIRRGNSIIPLNIKYDDLINADEKGRWWVVGSAWDGSGNQENNSKKETKGDQGNQSQNAYLLKLADSQRINTDLRRNIFCTIMSAEDYIDAFEKLQHLGLKNQQEREIIHVLIACCLQEKSYNPYYAILAQKFCDYDRKFQMSIQYTVWDKLKDLDTCSLFQITNLAQFLVHLFVEKGLPLSVLKVIEFSDLTKPSLRLMRQILLGILLHKSSQVCSEVFQRVAVSPKLHLFRESLRLFISHFLIKNSSKKENILDEDQIALLKERFASVDKILQSDSTFKF